LSVEPAINSKLQQFYVFAGYPFIWIIQRKGMLIFWQQQFAK